MTSILEPFASKHNPNETGTVSVYASVNQDSGINTGDYPSIQYLKDNYYDKEDIVARESKLNSSITTNQTNIENLNTEVENLNNNLNNKIDQNAIVGTTGSSTTKVMNQLSVSRFIDNFNKQLTKKADESELTYYVPTSKVIDYYVSEPDYIYDSKYINELSTGMNLRNYYLTYTNLGISGSGYQNLTAVLNTSITLTNNYSIDRPAFTPCNSYHTESGGNFLNLIEYANYFFQSGGYRCGIRGHLIYTSSMNLVNWDIGFLLYPVSSRNGPGEISVNEGQTPALNSLTDIYSLPTFYINSSGIETNFLKKNIVNVDFIIHFPFDSSLYVKFAIYIVYKAKTTNAASTTLSLKQSSSFIQTFIEENKNA